MQSTGYAQDIPGGCVLPAVSRGMGCLTGECGDGGWLRDRLRAATTSPSTSRHPTTGRLAAVAAAGSAVVCLLLEKRSTRRPLLAELRELVITIAHAQLAKGENSKPSKVRRSQERAAARAARDSFYNFALSAASANLGTTRSLRMNDTLPWALAMCFSALSAHSCSNVRFAILPRAAILSIMPKTY